jgi:two-component sensor histidine kinase
VGIEEKETWADGKKTWVLTTKVFMRDEYGKIIGTFGISRDITERKKMEDQIKADLKEKETLLKEVHHRVKNNLQIMSSLLNMQCQHTHDKKLLDILTIYRGRIQSMALVHQMIYQNSDFSRIHMIRYLNKMVHALSELYPFESKRIGIEVSGPDFCLDLDRAIPCGMILNELIVNAFKHAFPDGRNGHIRIDLREETGTVQLQVQDDGIPLPRDFDANRTETLGLKIVSDLTEQLEGRFSVVPNDEFKSFHIEFKIEEEKS